MASDLGIEIFAYNYFHSLWCLFGLIDIEPSPLEFYGDEITEDCDYLEDFYIFQNAIIDRIKFFSSIFTKKLENENYLKWESLSEYFEHLTIICDTEDLFCQLSIFERMIASCAFVLTACLSCIYKQVPPLPIDFYKYGHIIWAMYFDKFTEKFYEEGGWIELKRVVKKYEPFSLLRLIHLNDYAHLITPTTKQALSNYSQFKNVVKKENYQCKPKCRCHISKLWIKFRIENFEEYIRIPLCYDEFLNDIDYENLFQDVVHFCNPSLAYEESKGVIMKEELQEFISSIESKSFDKFEDIQAEDEHRIENLANGETFCNENSKGKKDIETEIKGELSTSSEKLQLYKNTGMHGNFKNVIRKTDMKWEEISDKYSLTRCNNLSASIMCQQSQTCRNFCQKHSDLESNYNVSSFDGEKENDLCDTASCFIVKFRNIVKNAGDVLPKNWENEPERDAKIPPDHQSKRMDIGLKSEVVEYHIEKKISESSLQSNTSEKNEYKKYADIACASSSATSTSKDDLCQIKAAKDYDGRTNTNKGLSIVREEQCDPDIKVFLRMIMVLDDREGIQYIRESLGCIEEKHAKPHTKSNKKKKKSKRICKE